MSTSQDIDACVTALHAWEKTCKECLKTPNPDAKSLLVLVSRAQALIEHSARLLERVKPDVEKQEEARSSRARQKRRDTRSEHANLTCLPGENHNWVLQKEYSQNLPRHTCSHCGIWAFGRESIQTYYPARREPDPEWLKRPDKRLSLSNPMARRGHGPDQYEWILDPRGPNME